MGMRSASGTKPSMLASQVPNVDEVEEIQKMVVESAPKEKARAPASKPSFMEAEFESATPVEMPQQEIQPAMAEPSPMPEQPTATAPVQPAQTPMDRKRAFMEASFEEDAEPQTYLQKIRNSFEPFEGKFAGVEFKRDKLGQFYYKQKAFGGSAGLAKTGVVPSEAEIKGGWTKVQDMPDSLKSYLNIGAGAWLDAPELSVSTAAGIGAAVATGGASMLPTLIAEVAAGMGGGYLGGTLAEQKFKQKVNSPEDAKALAFLESALRQEELRPTPPMFSAVAGGLGGMIPAAQAGLRAGYNVAKTQFNMIMARVKPEFARVLNELDKFAQSIGVNFNGADLARQIDPRIETKIGQIERRELGGVPQQQLITNSETKLAGLKGMLQTMRQKFAPQAETLLEGPEGITALVARQQEEDPFTRRVLKPRRELNFVQALEDNESMVLRQNAQKGRELAGNLRFDAGGLVAAMDDIMERSFSSFKELRRSGIYSDAELLNEFKKRNPKGAEEFARLYNNLKAITALPPSALAQPADTVFVETMFDAIPAERFQSSIVQEQLVTRRRPIEPGALGYQRPDLAERDYFVLGGPRGQPGAPMGQIGAPIPGQASRMPGGPSGFIGEGAGQVQESLFQTPVGSAAGPRMVESAEKAFLPPTQGGASYRGMTFDEIMEINQQAQNLVENIKNSNDKAMIGAASAIERATRNFEDDAMFKLGVVRGDEAYAEKVLTDKMRYANNKNAYDKFGKLFDKNSSEWSGAILKLKPEETEQLLGLLNDSQKEQIKGLILDKTYQDSVYSLLESGINTRIKPEKITKNILQTKESRDNIKLIFGEQALKDLDGLARVAEFANSTGEYRASEKEIVKAVSRFIRNVPQGARVGEFIGAMFMGNPTAEQIVSTPLKNWQTLIRKPEGGIIGKAGKAAAAFEERFGLPGRAALSTGAKVIPQVSRMVKRPKEQELEFGEMGE